MSTTAELLKLYFTRLDLNQADCDKVPTTAILFAIVQAHLEKIPFENLAQHGAVGGSVSLDIPDLIDKILVRNRGGFCFELNALLAHFLEHLGYGVNRVPAHVYVHGKFQSSADHMVLIVTVPPSKLEDESSSWFVDVGFGEPAINPLFYEVGGMEQMSTEGIMSRFVHDGKKDEDVVLEWYRPHLRCWTPRLRWDLKLGERGAPLEDFRGAVEIAKAESSTFSQKLIVCRLTREIKYTIAGNVFKKTGPPRFSSDPPSVDCVALESESEVKSVLEREFGIPTIQTQGLSLKKSIEAPEGLWGEL